MVQTYNEFKVIFNGKKVIDKKLTERGSVRISELTATTNNLYSKSTGLAYELAEQKPDRALLLLEAKDLGLDVPKNIKTDSLIEKINEVKE